MIAYKVFYEIDGKLCPFFVAGRIHYYDPKFIIQRADGCGPFACIDTLENLDHFYENYISVTKRYPAYRVKIKKSKARKLWIDNDIMLGLWNNQELPAGTVLADTFEILERVK